MPPLKYYETYFPATATTLDDVYRLMRLTELRKQSGLSVNKADIQRAAWTFYFAAQPEAAQIEKELEVQHQKELEAQSKLQQFVKAQM